MFISNLRMLRSVLFLLTPALLCSLAYAQRPPDMKLNAGINRQVVEGVD